MKTTTAKLLLVLLIFAFNAETGYGNNFKIDIQRKGNDTIVVSWPSIEKIDIKSINIYLYEGFHKYFPSEKIDNIPGKASVWYFIKGEREDFIGFDVRKTSQLFDKKYWTSSEIYTIGVELEYIDFKSQKTSFIRDYDYVFPFVIKNEQNITIPESSVDLKLLPASIDAFLKGDKFGVPYKDVILQEYSKIMSIQVSDDHYKIYLQSGSVVYYDIQPKRPELLGNSSFIFYALSIFVVVVLVILFFLLYLHVTAINLKNNVDNEIFDVEKKQVFIDFINRNKLATYIVFYLVKYFDNKKNREESWHDKIRLVFRKYRLYQTKEIKENIEKIITTNKIFKDMNSQKVFISYNHKDQEVAKRIKEKLEENDIEVIIDIEAMKTGENIESFIKNCIKHSAITLSLISSNSLKSAWVAMETNYSFYDVTLRGKYFVPCSIDNEFFKRSFADDALDKIKIEIDEIKTLVSNRLEKGRGIEDLQLELTRSNKLFNELPTILSKLKNSLCADLSEDNFDAGMSKLIEDINGFIENNH